MTDERTRRPDREGRTRSEPAPADGPSGESRAEKGDGQGWDALDALFEAVLDRPPEDREGFLARACADDPRLRDEVEALLEAAEAAEPWMEHAEALIGGAAYEAFYEETFSPEVEDGSALDDRRARPRMGSRARARRERADPMPGRRIGPWRILRRLARGGMGNVYLVERADGQFEQRAALKLLRRGLDTDDILRRFLAERQILATLAHPNIARLLDGGATENGRPYLVLEYVEGKPITDYCQARGLGVGDRLRLFATVCRAVQHAHRNLVLHRDLKPSNILVTREGQVKLLDFGIAKLLDDSAPGHTPRTRTGMRLMTPKYASPEQVRGEPVTTATDVYQLGMLLYELLAGARPYEIRHRSPTGIERAVCEEEPQPPSDRAREVQRGREGERLRRRLRGDLDAVVLQALRKEPERRYASAEALTADVERYRAGLPVSARPDTVAYRARKLVRRRPWLVPAAAAVALAVGGYLFTLDRHARQLERERNVATLQAERAEEVKEFLVGLFQSADPYAPANPDRGSRITVAEALDVGAERVRAELSGRPAIQGELLASISEVLRRLGQEGRATPVGEEALRALERAYGPNSGEVASALRRLAELATGRDDRDSAWALHSRALAAAVAAHGPGAPALAAYHQSLGSFYSHFGMPDSARAHRERAVDLLRPAAGSRAAELAQNLYQLAGTYRRLGVLQEARAALDEALPLSRAADGDDHPNTAFVLVADASLLRVERRFPEAEAAYREALEILERALGPEHAYVVSTLNNFGLLLGEIGDLEGEEQVHRRVLDIRRRTLGEDHSETAGSMQNLAANLNRQGRYREAEELLARAGAIFRTSLGPDHPHVAFSLLTRNEIRSKQGDHRGAERTAREALEILDRALPEGHWITAVAQCRLGRALAGQGRLEAARPLIEAAAATLEAQADAAGEHNVEECRAARTAL